MAIKDDLPSDEVVKKHKNSRMSSRRYDKKVSGKKKETKRSSLKTVMGMLSLMEQLTMVTLFTLCT
jgi:hypothetical protein